MSVRSIRENPTFFGFPFLVGPRILETKQIDSFFGGMMETDPKLPTGEWKGFYLEPHLTRRGWMHLYMSFDQGQIKGEGTDYVGPWTAAGKYDVESGLCIWTKQYVGKHSVDYEGTIGPNGIQGQWQINYFSNGQFHIWPVAMGHLDELYLQEDQFQTEPTLQLGTVTEDFESIG